MAVIFRSVCNSICNSHQEVFPLCTMHLTWLHLGLALTLIGQALGTPRSTNHVAENFHRDHTHLSTKSRADKMEYTLRNFTFPSSGRDHHDKMHGATPFLSVMIFDAEVYSASQAQDEIIDVVSYNFPISIEILVYGASSPGSPHKKKTRAIA